MRLQATKILVLEPIVSLCLFSKAWSHKCLGPAAKHFRPKLTKNIRSVKTNLKALLGLSHQLSLFKRLAIPNISRRKRYGIRPHVTQGRMATPSEPNATCLHFKSLGKSRLIPCIKELYVVREAVTDGIIWIARMYFCVWHSYFCQLGLSNCIHTRFSYSRTIAAFLL